MCRKNTIISRKKCRNVCRFENDSYLCSALREKHYWKVVLERWQSGRLRRSWKPLYCEVPGVRIPVSPRNVKDKWRKSKDKSRKIKVLRDFFMFVLGQVKDMKMSCLDKVVLPNRYWKSANKNSNDFNCKLLICRSLSLRCLFIHELLIVPLQREVRFLL